MDDRRLTIVFRADGSRTMGLGHVIRSAALADMLADTYRIIFLVGQLPDGIKSSISHQGRIDIQKLPESVAIGSVNDAQLTAAVARKMSPSGSGLVVTDGYHFDYQYQKEICKQGHKLFCIDDIHATSFVADVIINHGPSARQSQYKALPDTEFYLGLKYALLRRPFRKAVTQFTVQNENCVFVCFGGGDPQGLTLSAVKRVLQEEEMQAHVVVGGASHLQEDIGHLAEAYPERVVLYRQLEAEDMARVMLKCGRAITPPSTVAIEYLSTGGQLYLHPFVDNQQEFYAHAIRVGIALDVSAFPKGEVNNHKLQETFDGKIKARYAAIFARHLATIKNLEWREATVDDSQLYFDWANDSVVRRNSIQQDSIPWGSHINWFDRSLANADRVLLVFQQQGKPCGQLRFDIDKEVATLGFSIAAAFRGKGLGLKIVLLAETALAQKRPEVRKILAFVKPMNIASIRTFERAGYEIANSGSRDKSELIKFEKVL